MVSSSSKQASYDSLIFRSVKHRSYLADAVLSARSLLTSRGVRNWGLGYRFDIIQCVWFEVVSAPFSLKVRSHQKAKRIFYFLWRSCGLQSFLVRMIQHWAKFAGKLKYFDFAFSILHRSSKKFHAKYTWTMPSAKMYLYFHLCIYSWHVIVTRLCFWCEHTVRQHPPPHGTHVSPQVHHKHPLFPKCIERFLNVLSFLLKSKTAR